MPHIWTPPIVPVTPKRISRSPGRCIKPRQVRTLSHSVLYITRCSVLSKERTFNRCQKPQCRVKASRVWRNKLKVQQKMLVRKIKYCCIFGGGLSRYFHSKITCSCIGANRTQLPLFSPLCKFWPSPGEDHRLAMALKAASTHPPTSPSVSPEQCPTFITLQNIKLNVLRAVKPFFWW